MTNKASQKQIKAIEEERLLRDANANKTRARSIMVGTSFGGTVEISMRADDGGVLWSPMQPVEVAEFIHQLAAGIGCHIHLTPRQDFSSWRNWRVTEQERKHLQGHPPFSNDMSVHMEVGTDKFSLEDQSLADSFFPPEMRQNEHEKELSNVVAAQKNIDR
jgi:hypothetical protein